MVDLYGYLLRNRVVFLNQRISDTVAIQVVASLLALDSLDSTAEIKLYINCPQVGGWVGAGQQQYTAVQRRCCLRSDTALLDAQGRAACVCSPGSWQRRCRLQASRPACLTLSHGCARFLPRPPPARRAPPTQ